MNKVIFKRIALALFSGRTALWLGAFWLLYYMTLALWTEEVFSQYIMALGVDALYQAFFVLFLMAFGGHIARSFYTRVKRSRAEAILWVVLPLSLWIFLAAFLVSATIRQQGVSIFGEGDVVTAPWDSEPLVLQRVIHGLPARMTDIDETGLWRYKPGIDILRQDGSTVNVGTFPPARIGSTYYHLLEFGMAPGMALRKDGQTLQRGYIIQRILPPGAVDEFELKPLPYRVTLGLAPSEVLEKGSSRKRIYDIESPTYSVRLVRGQAVLFEGDTKGPVEFEGYSMSLEPPAYWVRLEINRNPAYMWLSGSLLLMPLGLVMYIGYLILIARRFRADYS